MIQSSVCSIDVVGLAELRRADNLHGDVMAPVHHVKVHITVKPLERMFLKQRG